MHQSRNSRSQTNLENAHGATSFCRARSTIYLSVLIAEKPPLVRSEETGFRAQVLNRSAPIYESSRVGIIVQRRTSKLRPSYQQVKKRGVGFFQRPELTQLSLYASSELLLWFVSLLARGSRVSRDLKPLQRL